MHHISIRANNFLYDSRIQHKPNLWKAVQLVMLEKVWTIDQKKKKKKKKKEKSEQFMDSQG